MPSAKERLWLVRAAPVVTAARIVPSALVSQKATAAVELVTTISEGPVCVRDRDATGSDVLLGGLVLHASTRGSTAASKDDGSRV